MEFYSLQDVRNNVGQSVAISKLRKLNISEFIRLPQYCLCGAYLEYTDNLKHHRCSKAHRCLYTKATRSHTILIDLGIKGVGEKWCLSQLRNMSPRMNPLAILNYDLWSNKSGKKEIQAKQQIKEASIEYWKLYRYLYRYTGDNKGIEEFIGTATCASELNEAYKDKYQDLFYDAKLVDEIKTRLGKIIYRRYTGTLEVMITGAINGYTPRDKFINYLNSLELGVQIKNCNKKGSAKFLITDSNVTGTAKYNLARRNGIPILTSEEFLKYLKGEK